MVVEAIFYVSETGCQWRMLPEGNGAVDEDLVAVQTVDEQQSGQEQRVHDSVSVRVAPRRLRAACVASSVTEGENDNGRAVAGPSGRRLVRVRSCR